MPRLSDAQDIEVILMKICTAAFAGALVVCLLSSRAYADGNDMSWQWQLSSIPLGNGFNNAIGIAATDVPRTNRGLYVIGAANDTGIASINGGFVSIPAPAIPTFYLARYSEAGVLGWVRQITAGDSGRL